MSAIDGGRDPATAPGVALFTRTRCAVVTDLDGSCAELEVYEGDRGASMQIATEHSHWVLIALHPHCIVETVDGRIPVAAGEVLMLPAGMAALLFGQGWGEWLALRFDIAAAAVASADDFQLAFGPAPAIPELARALVAHLHAGGGVDAARAQARCVRQLRHEVRDFQQRHRRLHAERMQAAGVTHLRPYLPMLLRMRLADMHGDGASTRLDGVISGSGLTRAELLSAYSRCYPDLVDRPDAVQALPPRRAANRNYA